jgi:hypothetical protein
MEEPEEDYGVEADFEEAKKTTEATTALTAKADLRHAGRRSALSARRKAAS